MKLAVGDTMRFQALLIGIDDNVVAQKVKDDTVAEPHK